MNTRNFLFTTTLLLFFSAAYAQEEKTISRVNVSDLYIQAGISHGGDVTGTFSDFQKLAPNSALLKNDFTDYEWWDRSTYQSSSEIFSLLLGIQFSNKEKAAYKTNPKLRLGLTYLSESGISGSLTRFRTQTIDTLSSDQSDREVYVDSVNSSNYNMNYDYEQLRLDASLLFRTNPEQRFSLFAGIGMTAGISINSGTEIIHYKSTRTELRDPNSIYHSSYTNLSSMDSERQSENFQNQTNYGFSAYVPLGIDFRMGNKREFWKRLHLFYEARPGISFIAIPELETITSTTVQQGLGVRVSWN